MQEAKNIFSDFDVYGKAIAQEAANDSSWIGIVFEEFSHYYPDMRQLVQQNRNYVANIMKRWGEYFKNQRITVSAARQAVNDCIHDKTRKKEFSPTAMEFSGYVKIAMSRGRDDSRSCTSSNNNQPRQDAISKIVDVGYDICREIKKSQPELSWKEINSQFLTLLNMKKAAHREDGLSDLELYRMALLDLKPLEAI